MSDFCLTDDQWNIVASAMNTFGNYATCENRAEIEEACRVFIQRRTEIGKLLPKPSEKVKRWRAVADAAKNLTEAIEADPEVRKHITLLFRLPDQTSSILMRQIDALRGVAEDMTGHISARPRTPSASDPDLEQLQKRLVSFWFVSGGAVGSSTSSKDGAPSGPLIRFLGATLVPALAAAGMKIPSTTAIREVVRKIKAQMDDQLLETLYQVAAGKPFTTHGVLRKIEKLRDARRLNVGTIPLDLTVASRAVWPEYWNPADRGYWAFALDCWLNALKISEATDLDVWLSTQAKKGRRVSVEPPAYSGELVWEVERPSWPVEMMQNYEDENADQEDEARP